MLLLDEPTSGLGEAERDAHFDPLLAAADRSGTTVVVVTHDEEVAGRMQRMVRMRDGRVGTEGLRHEQYAVIGADGSIQLPEALAAGWPPGPKYGWSRSARPSRSGTARPAGAATGPRMSVR